MPGAPGKSAQYIMELAGAYHIGKGVRQIEDGHILDGVGTAVQGALMSSGGIWASKFTTKPRIVLLRPNEAVTPSLKLLPEWDKGTGQYSIKDTGKVTDLKHPNNQFDGKNTYDAKGAASKNTNVPAETGSTLIFHENLGGMQSGGMLVKQTLNCQHALKLSQEFLLRQHLRI